jgi:hypothetical protein
MDASQNVNAREPGMKWILIFAILPQVAFATVTVGNMDCPTQFEGRVSQKIEPMGAQTGFATDKVVFINNRTIKGEVDEKVFVDVLKEGPFDLEQGEDYQVQLRDGKVCWIEKI